jgi:predicted dienelactone hydrolase
MFWSPHEFTPQDHHERRNIMLTARLTAARVLAEVALVGGFWLGLVINSAAGGTKLGIETVPLKDARDRDVTTEVWYPASDTAVANAFAARPFLQPVQLSRGAPYCCEDEKSHPLVVISHGIFGNRFSQGWLARALVAHGYIVATVTHPNTTSDDITAAGIYRLWDRAEDVSVVLDHLLSHPKWSARIDPARIGFVGHSFGGGTGVVLAGGTHDAEALIRFCKTPAGAKDTYCEPLAKLDLQRLGLRPTKTSYRDQRIRAFYIMASAPAQGFTVETLRSIRIPFVMETATLDEILDNAVNSLVFAREIPGASGVNRPVGHFAYVPLCVSGSVPPQAASICADPPGVARDNVHELVGGAIVQFLEKYL